MEDETPPIRFVYIPKPPAWLTQVEIWFTILVRNLLKRTGFPSIEALPQRRLDFIDDGNETNA